MRNTQPENIQEHSLQVAVIAHALALIRNQYYGGDINADRVAVLGMYHDSNEIFTGDLPTPIKYYNPEIKKVYKEIENISKRKLLSMLPEELVDSYSKIIVDEREDACEWKLVKAADRIAAYIKCVEEAKVGNREFNKASDTIYKSILEIGLPEVDYFMKNFMPSFFLTLDELE